MKVRIAGTVLVAALVSFAGYAALFIAPDESTMHEVQRIFYFHLPAWMTSFTAFAIVFVSNIAYLTTRRLKWDCLGVAAAEVGVACCSIGLITGPLWGAKAWGSFWTWDPRLTTALLSFLIYVAYLVLRAFAGDGTVEKRFSAALGVLGAANLPIIHYSVQKWGGQHPMVITGSGGGLQHPDMKLALAGGFLCFTLIAALMLWARAGLELARSRLARAEADAIDLGLDTRTEG